MMDRLFYYLTYFYIYHNYIERYTYSTFLELKTIPQADVKINTPLEDAR